MTIRERYDPAKHIPAAMEKLLFEDEAFQMGAPPIEGKHEVNQKITTQIIQDWSNYLFERGFGGIVQIKQDGALIRIYFSEQVHQHLEKIGWTRKLRLEWQKDPEMRRKMIAGFKHEMRELLL